MEGVTSIPVDSHSDLICLVRQLKQLVLGSPFCALGSLLVELAQVVKVVDIVAIARWRGGFASRRNPHVIDADGFELRKLVVETDPMLVIVWDVPFESLHHRHVLWRGFLLCEGQHGNGFKELISLPDSAILSIVSIEVLTPICKVELWRR